MLVMHFITADRVKARPLAIIQAVAQRECAIVKCGTNGQWKNLTARKWANKRLYRPRGNVIDKKLLSYRKIRQGQNTKSHRVTASHAQATPDPTTSQMGLSQHQRVECASDPRSDGRSSLFHSSAANEIASGAMHSGQNQSRNGQNFF
jgi:hypothetical protein